MKYYILSFGFLALAACEASTKPPVPERAPPPDTCNAAEHEGLIGQDVTVLEQNLLLGPVRIIRPGQLITQDYLPERVNFNVNAADKVTSVRCG